MFVRNKKNFKVGDNVRLLNNFEANGGLFIPPHIFKVDDIQTTVKNETFITLVDDNQIVVKREKEDIEANFEVME